jgi:hypothetical protein
MWYRILAECVMVAHFVFILWAIFGGLAVLKKRALAWLHLPALAWAAAIEFMGGVCPLTPLEGFLREKAGGKGYGDGFIAHYLLPLIYPDGMTQKVQVILGSALLGFNALVYIWLLFRIACPAKEKKELA